MNRRKILIIEDDSDHTELILDELNLEDDDREDVILKDGQEAIDYFQKTRIKGNGKEQSIVNLIILDLNLPKICGMDILKIIKSNPRYRSIPTVILSTSSDQEIINQAFEEGANDYITKPISYDEYVEKIRILKKYC